MLTQVKIEECRGQQIDEIVLSEDVIVIRLVGGSFAAAEIRGRFDYYSLERDPEIELGYGGICLKRAGLATEEELKAYDLKKLEENTEFCKKQRRDQYLKLKAEFE